ncbi:MAG: hypothetical protein ACXVAJ_07695, partial [Parachlamydiaceae bacterium]
NQIKNKNKANTFLFACDSEGKTVLHYFLGMKQNLQQQTIAPLFSNLTSEVLKKGLLTRDSAGHTPLGIAIAHGQMAILSKIFPLPPNENSIQFTKEEKSQIVKEVKNLLLLFADPLKREELLTQCPGANNYDKQNHILSALHHLVSYGFNLSSGISSISEEQRLNIPKDFRLLVENSPISEKLSELQNNLCRECSSLNSKTSINEKMDEWEYEKKRLAPTNLSINYSKALNVDSQNKLLGLIKAALTSKEEKDKNSYLNYLSMLLNPFEPYDQKIDFTDSRYNDILHQVVDLAIQHSSLGIETDIKPIISQLIHKYPDFLEKKSGKDQNIFEYLARKKEMVGILEHELNVILEIENILKEIEQSLMITQFSNQTKKSLKYYLEDRGRELQM